jgi:glycogen synthase
MTRSGLKVAYISGPANLRQIYREWSGHEQQAYFGTDYMKQFLQVASDVGAQAYIVSWYGDRRETFRLGDFTIHNRPISTSSGIGYYVAHFLWHLNVLCRLFAFRPDVLLLTGNQNFWWLLAPIRLWRPKIIISYHAVLWPKFRQPGPVWRLMLKLNAMLILRHAKAILVTSADIRRQVEKVLGDHRDKVEILDHLPTYSRKQFDGIKAPTPSAVSPFRVIFMGRIVRNKGIYDLLAIARRLHERRKGEFTFDICGDGEDLGPLIREVERLELQDVLVCHGFCDAPELGMVLGMSDAAIVPTRSDFEAGFEMTCSEAILAGRPLITSAVCPALEHLAGAAVEAIPDDVNSYEQAIERLRDEPDLYECKRNACAGLQEQFYDQRNSWYAALMQALNHHALPETSDATKASGTREVAAD